MEWLAENAAAIVLLGAFALMAWMHLRPGGHGCGMGGHEHTDEPRGGGRGQPERPVGAPPPARPLEVRVRVRGRYEPSAVVVPAGEPVRLLFTREETARCSERVVFGDYGKAAMLPPFREVVVDLPPAEPGEHPFTCGRGVLRGRLIVRPRRGN